MVKDPISFKELKNHLEKEADNAFIKNVVRLFKRCNMKCDNLRKKDPKNELGDDTLFCTIDGFPMCISGYKMFFADEEYIKTHLPELRTLSEKDFEYLFVNNWSFYSVDMVRGYFKEHNLKKLLKPKLRPMSNVGVLDEGVKPEDFLGLPKVIQDREIDYQTDFHAIYVDTKKLITPIFLKQVQTELKELGVDFQIDYDYNDTVEDVRVYVDKIPMRMLDHRRLMFCHMSEILQRFPEIQAGPDYQNIFAGNAPAHFYNAQELADYFETHKIKNMLKTKLRQPSKMGVFERIKTFKNFSI